MVEEGAPGVVQIELLAQVCHYDHGEFQPFALVDAHDTHHILAVSQSTGCGKICLPLLQFLDKAQETEKPPIIGLLKICRPVCQHAQVGLLQ